eukprot:g30476.t1
MYCILVKQAYTVNGRALGSVVKQRDLGVQVYNSLKIASHVDTVVKKTFSTLAFIAQTFEYRSWDVMLRLYRKLGSDVLLKLYKAQIRPHLEYCEQFWAVYLRTDVLVLEEVQKRFTRMIPEMKGLSHEEWLRTVGLYSMEFRRTRGDLRGLDRVNVEK